MVCVQSLALAAALLGGGDTVLLDFTASWCGPCQTMNPTVRRLENEGFAVRKVDFDQERTLANQLGVRSIPCFIMLVNGREVDRVVGCTTYDRLVRMYKMGGAQSAGSSPAAMQPADGLRVRGQSPDLRPTESRVPNHPFPPVAAPSSQPYSQPYAQPAMASGSPAYTSPASSRSERLSASEQCLASTVRLKIDDAQGSSYGTGTIIDVHGEECLVLTCGHIFRDSQGKGKILVDLFLPGVSGPALGKLIRYDLKRDVGLVSFRPSVKVAAARVAPAGYRASRGDRVFSIGCDRGSEPSVQQSQVNSVNKYQGPPNVQVAGQPVDGRSGGGLFSQEGLLIGVCNAADREDNEGLYAALPSIQGLLDESKLTDVYASSAPISPVRALDPRTPDAMTSRTPPPPAMPSQMPERPSNSRVAQADYQEEIADPRTEPAVGHSPRMDSRMTGEPRRLPAAGGSDGIDRLSDTERLVLDSLLRKLGGPEGICVVRPASAPGNSPQMTIIDRPSAALLQQIYGQNDARPADARLADRPQDDYGPGVIRGQSPGKY